MIDWGIYEAAKAAQPDHLILMRVGDFYEAYGYHAERLAKVLQITLTARVAKGERIAMSGLPFHSIERYVTAAYDKGENLALLDQLVTGEWQLARFLSAPSERRGIEPISEPLEVA